MTTAGFAVPGANDVFWTIGSSSELEKVLSELVGVLLGSRDAEEYKDDEGFGIRHD